MGDNGDIRAVLERASKIAGVDLTKELDRRKKKEDRLNQIEETRAALPTAKHRKEFDRALKLQKREQQQKNRKKSDAERVRNANKKILDKLERRLKALGIKNPHPVIVESHVYKRFAHIIGDNTGKAVQYYSRICKHKIGLIRVHRAALCPNDDGTVKYSYQGFSRESIRARRVFAVGIFFLLQSKQTARAGDGWNRLVKGMPEDVIVDLLKDPHRPDKSLHRNAFAGTHRPDKEHKHTDGKVGYLRALKNTGVLYSRQCKWKDGENPRDQKGWADLTEEEMAGKKQPSGYYTSLARYHVVSEEYLDPKNAEKQAIAQCDWLAGLLPWEKDENDIETPLPGIPQKEPAERAKPPP